MAKVNIKGIDKLSKTLDRNLKIEVSKLFRNQELRLRIGQIVVKDIKENVNFGSPAESTLDWRKRYDPINFTDPTYRRNKLSAVFTGELLNDLATSIKARPTDRSFEIAHSEKRHKKYQGVTKKIGSRSTYKEISEGLVSNLGYDYFKLTQKTRKLITNEVREELLKLLSNV